MISVETENSNSRLESFRDYARADEEGRQGPRAAQHEFAITSDLQQPLLLSCLPEDYRTLRPVLFTGKA